MDPEGIEPSTRRCERRVIPFHYGPILFFKESRLAGESNSSHPADNGSATQQRREALVESERTAFQPTAKVLPW